MTNDSVRQLSLGSAAARNLATATVTVPQNAARTPRWLHKLLPWVDADGGVYRVNRRKTTVQKPGFVSSVVEGETALAVPQTLKGIPLFGGLDDSSLQIVASLFTCEVRSLDETLFSEGDLSNKLIVVAKGKVELSVMGPHGDKLRQNLLGEGSFYGEGALVSESLRVPKGVALTKSILLVLEKTKLDELKNRNPEIAEKIARTLEENGTRSVTANEHGETGIDLLTWDGGEPILPNTFVDYEEDPREYHLSTIQTILRTHTRVTDLYSNRIDQLREQVRLTIEAVKEWEEWELLNNPGFGLLREVHASQRITTRTGPPTPDDLDELLSLVWKKPAFFLAHPRAIAAFGRSIVQPGQK